MRQLPTRRSWAGGKHTCVSATAAATAAGAPDCTTLHWHARPGDVSEKLPKRSSARMTVCARVGVYESERQTGERLQ